MDHKKSLLTIKESVDQKRVERETETNVWLAIKRRVRETGQQSRPYQQVQLTLAVDDEFVGAGCRQ